MIPFPPRHCLQPRNGYSIEAIADRACRNAADGDIGLNVSSNDRTGGNHRALANLLA